MALTYKGLPWVRDEKATAGTVHMLNEQWIEFYGWDPNGAAGYTKISLGTGTTEGVYADEPSPYTGFAWSGFHTPTNQFGEVADVIMLGNFASWQPRRQGKLTAVTGV